MDNNTYTILDFTKFIFAVLLVCAHYSSEYGHFPKMLDMCFSIYIIAVPFYFASSAFLFFSKNNKNIILFFVRIMKMYICWSIIYFIFVVLDWMINGTNVDNILRYIHKSLVYTTYSTIWFLPALAVGMVLTYFLSKRISRIALLIIAILLYCVGTLGKSYSFLIENTIIEKGYNFYNNLFFTTRNGLFNAFPFCCIGYFLAHLENNKSSAKKYAILSLVFFIHILAESLLLKLYFHNSDENTIISLLPFTYCFLRFVVGIKTKSIKLLVLLRKTSTYIFVTQRIWLSAIPIICVYYCNLISYNSYLGLIIVLFLTIMCSLLLAIFSKKYKVLSVLG